MAIVWKVILIHRAADGTYTEQDITLRTLQRSSRQIIVEVPWRDRLDYNIRSGKELWQGFRDDVSLEWQNDESLWGGYIFGEIVKYKGREKRNKGMFVWECPIIDYEVLFDTSALRGYPLDPVFLNPYVPSPVRRTYHVPPVPEDNDNALKGYTTGGGGGYTPKDYLVGEEDGVIPKPHDGVVPRTLRDIDLTGVHSDFTSDTFDLTARPGNTAVLGHMEMLNLRGMIAMIMSCATLVMNNDPLIDDMDPYWTMRAVPNSDDPTAIRPQFVAINLLNVTTPDWSYTDDPADEDFTTTSRWKNYYETWTARPGQTLTRTMVFGAGSDYYGADPLTYGRPLHTRVYAENTEGIDGLPVTYYQREPGWTGTPIHDDRVTKISTAVELAATIQKVSNHEQVSIHFETKDPIRKGDIVEVLNTSTAMNGVFPVTNVDWNDVGGRRTFIVTAGARQLTPQDILGGQAAQMILMGQAGIRRGRAGESYNFIDPRLPLSTPPDNIPAGRFGGQRQSLTSDVATDWRRTAIDRIKMTPEGQAISDDVWNFLESTVGEPATRRPVAGTDKLPAPVYIAGGLTVNEWDDADGRNGPQHHYFSFTYDRTVEVLLPDGAIITTAAVKFINDDTTDERLETASFTADGLDIATPAGVGVIDVELRYFDPTVGIGGEYVTVTPDVSRTAPLIVSFREDLQLRVTGIPDGQRISVLVSERKPDLRFYDYPITVP